MKKIMMIGLVVFGGTQGIYGMSLFNRHVKPLGNLTPAFLTSIFTIQSRNLATQAWESDLAAKIKTQQARGSLSELANKKYAQRFGKKRLSRRSWIPNPDSPRFQPKLRDTLTRQIHSDVLAMYGA